MRRAPRIALMVGALVVGGAGLLALGMIGGGGCVSEDIRRAPDGAWRIERDDCGATVAFVWRVHLRGTDGRERMAFENFRHPDVVDAELDGTVLRVRGTAPDRVWQVALDAALRPLAPLRLYDGAPRR